MANPDPDIEPVSAGPSRKAGIETSAKDVQQTSPDTGLRTSSFATEEFHAAPLSKASRMLCKEVPYVINLPMDHLWKSYPVEDQLLTDVEEYLIKNQWLTKGRKWYGKKAKEDSFRARGRGGHEVRTFVFFSLLFNAVLDGLKATEHKTFVERMVHAGSVEPESTRVSTHRPDGFLQMATDTSATPGKFRWRELTCPFEYKFGDCKAVGNDTKALWDLLHIMRCDPVRMFSFGSTVRGTKFRIWLLCRAAPFTFTAFDWFKDPSSLIKFFVLLATSSEADLGFDTNIKRAGGTDFDLEFTIEEREYRASKLLYDIGANALTGRGSRVFEVTDQGTKKARVIKDCWIEDRPDKQMEHVIVAEIERDMGAEKFDEFFIGIHGHRKTEMSGGFKSICDILKNKTFIPADEFKPLALIPTDTPKPSYTASASVADQEHHLQQTPAKWASEHPPHPRFRYQVVYGEVGMTLFEEDSFGKVFHHISRAAYGLYLLHRAGWVHRDPSPGNIIVVRENANTSDRKIAKISDLEFAKRRVAAELEKLTKPKGASSIGARDIRTGTPDFAAIEAEAGKYMFLPMSDSGRSDHSEAGSNLEWEWDSLEDRAKAPKLPSRETKLTIKHTDRIWLYNPLHDYESVWWIAVWAIFSSKPKGVSDDVMKKARHGVYLDRSAAFTSATITQACKLLPDELQPLGEVLVQMNIILVNAYRSFEESFDGSKMLDVFAELMPRLQDLEKLAQNLDVKPKILGGRSEAGKAEFDVVALDEEQSVVAEPGGSMLGKRRRADPPPQLDRVLRQKR